MSQKLNHRWIRCILVATVSAMASVAFAGSAIYAYDSLGRLTRVTYSNGIVVNYTYDAAGNRSETVVTGKP